MSIYLKIYLYVCLSIIYLSILFLLIRLYFCFFFISLNYLSLPLSFYQFNELNHISILCISIYLCLRFFICLSVYLCLSISIYPSNEYLLRFLDMHMYITSALQKTDMKAVGLQLALELLHEKVKHYYRFFVLVFYLKIALNLFIISTLLLSIWIIGGFAYSIYSRWENRTEIIA